ncbi:hypothetical protein MN608_08491 [Microdochium nivale]|nr:hypothetical protein MN608_08491 [Microdochium nivale]
MRAAYQHGGVRRAVRDRYHGLQGSRLLRCLDGIFGSGSGENGDGEVVVAGKDDRYLEECMGTLPLTLVLCLTPNLANMSVSLLSDYVVSTLSKLFKHCAAPGRVDAGGPLSSLTRLEVTLDTPTGNPGSISDENIASLVFSRRLEKVSCFGIDWDRGHIRNKEEQDDDEDYASYDLDQRVTPLRVVSRPAMRHFRLGDANPAPSASVRDMLLIFSSLETLELDYPLYETCEDHPLYEAREEIDLSQYGNVLREFGGKMRRFELEPWRNTEDDFVNADEDTIGSLREGMASLEQLRMPLAALVRAFPGEEGGGQGAGTLDLCAILPRGLRGFWTSVSVTGDVGTHWEALVWMLDSADNEDRLPLLEWVLVRLSRRGLPQSFESVRFSTTRLGHSHVLFRKRNVGKVRIPPGWAEVLKVELALELEAGLRLPADL